MSSVFRWFRFDIVPRLQGVAEPLRGRCRADHRPGACTSSRADLRARSAAGVLGIGLLSIAGCGEPSERNPRDRGTADVLYSDSAGVEIVRSLAPGWRNRPGWEVDSVPEILIETPPSTEDGGFALFEVGAIERLSDGRLVVLNRGTAELLVFDSLGSYLEAWGGRGEGPGEFRVTIDLFTCAGDTLIVRGQGGRAIVLDSRGREVRRVVSLSRSRGEGGAAYRWGGVRPDCSAVLLGWMKSRDAQRLSDRGTNMAVFDIFWHPLNGESADSIGRFLATEWDPDAVLPFSLVPSWVTAGAPPSIFYGRGDRPEIEVFDAEGRLKRLIRWSAERSPLTDSDWDAYESDFRRTGELRPGAQLPPRVSRESSPIQEKPLFGAGSLAGDSVPALIVDRQRHLWVRRYQRITLNHLVRGEAPAQRWWVFDPAGRWLGELETPRNFRIRLIDHDRLIGVSVDRFGAERIRTVGLDRGGGPGG